MSRRVLAGLAVVFLVPQCVHAETITAAAMDESSEISGTTNSIANAFTGSPHLMGTHFHSTNLTELPPGNPPVVTPGVSEVGGFFGDEEIRGTSEFGLGQVTALEATVLFDVLDLFELGISSEPSGIDGLFGQGPYVGSIDVFAYRGNNQEDLSDFQIAPISTTPLFTIDVAPAVIVAGETLSVDVTETYNDLVSELASDPANAATALGIRLQMAPADADAGAITFGNFRLQVANVPEPSCGWLLLSGLVAIVCRSRRTRGSKWMA